MLMKLRPRYYCDHCKRASGSPSAMKKHELGCTKNPARVCGMCREARLGHHDIVDLVAAAQRDFDEWKSRQVDRDPESWSDREVEPVHLRTAADGCPACMLAAIRTFDCEVYFDFKFEDEKKAFWDEVNSDSEP